MRRAATILAVLLVCAGGGGSTGSATGNDDRLTVFAAASLTRILPTLDSSARYEFAGSNALALQIQQGAPADVFVSASPKYVVDLQSKGLLVGKPSWFASNRLVLIVPRANPAHIRTPKDLTGPGVRLVIAAQGVPAGDYARKSLAGMHLDSALKNVVSNEPDVEGVVAKVALGEADAGFVYWSDARAFASKVRTVPLPPAGHYVAVYGAAVVKDAPHAADARGFLLLLVSPPAQKALRAAGFGPAPKG